MKNDRYIFKIPEEGFNYTQYDFSWLPYLKQQSFIATDLTGDIQLKRKPAQNQDTASLGSLASSSKPYLR